MPSKVDFQGDFSELAEFIGTGQAWTEVVKTPFYISELIAAAHSQVKKTFDAETAVAAQAGGHLSHMYEWGTVGINQGKGTPPLSPTSPLAKLWNHRLTGSGSNRGIDFTFLPSKVPVPLPDTSGMTFRGSARPPTSRHIFHAKAWVTEFNMPTIIKPKNAQALFIPVREGMAARTRGYFMTRHPVVVRHRKGAGQFTTHWHAWWNSEGRAAINEVSETIVQGGARRTIYTGARALGRYSGIKVGRTKSFTLQVESAKSRAYAAARVRESQIMSGLQRDTFESNLAEFGDG